MYSMVRILVKERTNKALTVSKDVISLGNIALLVSPEKKKNGEYSRIFSTLMQKKN